jgi:hypothetical protein
VVLISNGAAAEIDRIIRKTVKDPLGPEFMAPLTCVLPVVDTGHLVGILTGTNILDTFVALAALDRKRNER